MAFDDEDYLKTMAELARQEREGSDVSFKEWQVEFAISSTNLMMLAKDMAEALGQDHPLSVRFRAWTLQAMALVASELP